jgi:5-(carboxyamino)imidazole ribonucleotide synthase
VDVQLHGRLIGPAVTPPSIGVVGGGQLARLMQPPAMALGIELVVLVEDPSSGAGPVIPRHIVGPADSADALRALAAATDVVTVDHEVLDLGLMATLETEGVVLRPGAATLEVAADKLAQKQFFAGAKLPVLDFVQVRSAADLASQPWPGLVIKTATGGYDGRGVWVRPPSPEVETVLAWAAGSGVRLLAEEAVSPEMELAVVLARRPSGEMVVYDPVQTIQGEGMCRAVVAPAPIPNPVATVARTLAEKVAGLVEVVGTMAVEMFLVEGEVLVNEIAPRPHNSGHHTIDACSTSQFENHLRAVLDLPLGDAGLRGPAAMVNLVGSNSGVDPRDRLADGLAADPSARIHLYHKVPRPERKIGHVTVCDDDPRRALERAWKVVEIMGGEVRR